MTPVNPDAATVDTICRDVRALVVGIAPRLDAIDDEASLFDVAHVDSLTFLAILRKIEERYGLAVFGSDLGLAECSSIRALATYVTAHAAVAAGSVDLAAPRLEIAR
jgi:acyl carrier protein